VSDLPKTRAPSTHEAGPRAPAQVAIGFVLIATAVALWIDAAGLPVPAIGGVGPAAAPRTVGVLLAGLGLAHLVNGWRARGRLLEADRGNHRSLAWVMAALVGLIVVLEVGGGFVIGAAWLFAATAHAFGEPLRLRSVALGLGISLLVFLFFTRVLSLALPSGPLERLLLG
jgi:putative tricarboxylic transport membrane protein